MPLLFVCCKLYPISLPPGMLSGSITVSMERVSPRHHRLWRKVSCPGFLCRLSSGGKVRRDDHRAAYELFRLGIPLANAGKYGAGPASPQSSVNWQKLLALLYELAVYDPGGLHLYLAEGVKVYKLLRLLVLGLLCLGRGGCAGGGFGGVGGCVLLFQLLKLLLNVYTGEQGLAPVNPCACGSLPNPQAS